MLFYWTSSVLGLVLKSVKKWIWSVLREVLIGVFVCKSEKEREIHSTIMFWVNETRIREFLHGWGHEEVTLYRGWGLIQCTLFVGVVHIRGKRTYLRGLRARFLKFDVISLAVWTIFVILNFSLQVLAMKIFSKNFKNCKTNRERIDYCWIVNSDVLAVISSVISFSEWIDNASSDFWCSRLTGLLLPPLLSESPFSVLFCRMLLKIDSLSFWQKN